MSGTDLFIGNYQIKEKKQEVKGEFIKLNGENYYKISNYNAMQPFFITLASDSDHWMYISSTGGLSAGRKNPDNALFPYYTDDKITESAEITGSKTIMHVSKDGKKQLWEPFSDNYNGIYQIERNLYKSTIGNKLLFEECNFDLGLTFSYCWMNSDKFGWVKKSKLTNNSETAMEIVLLDGLQNILPYGTSRFTQNKFSTLVDAYKKSELIKDSNLALFRLESIPVDKAEPSEALKVTTVWTHGIHFDNFLLSSGQLAKFRLGAEIIEETESKGIKGAFFANTKLQLGKEESQNWYIIAELNQDSLKVRQLINLIKNSSNPAGEIESDISKGTETLKAIVAKADGLQQTEDINNVSRHFSNVLFNVMRGGIYNNGYLIDIQDFKNHIKYFNSPLWNSFKDELEQLPKSCTYFELKKAIEGFKNTDLERLFLEYLPLSFSRRHGDPSRPWNLFSIDIKEKDGSQKLNYEGNWRDIFQNWEALSLAFPEYINGIIAKFVNATTADGYNPYRVTRNGIDWEVIEPDNPWSNIGYWGDHQIIYLLKLMELSQKHFPERLVTWLNKDLFAYANVPYRIRSYHEILANPHNSIYFEDELHKKIENLVPEYGADAKLILDAKNQVIKVNFTEKLLATFLSKMSNFIPEAGIWMNTLRPEWNDANNALVGYGVSMVTLYYMRRFVVFAQELFKQSTQNNYPLSSEMFRFFNDVNQSLQKHINVLTTGFSNEQRKQLADQLGEAGTTFRNAIYKGLSATKDNVKSAELISFLNLCQQFIDQSIDANWRTDKMYNAYNLISIKDNAITIRYLYEMLEGQVAVLSSGKLSTSEAVEVLDAMRISSLYRKDQESYILYPNKKLPKFLDKNNIEKQHLNESNLLKRLAEMGNKDIIDIDVDGNAHFNAEFCNAGYLNAALENLKDHSIINFSSSEKQEVLDIYEKVFDHLSFTGRSGSFYKYEGLGSIYWHMVSKLLLVVGEYIITAQKQNESQELIKKLEDHYFQIKKGIGAHKSPKEYGAFPFDPYSHTPAMAGVQQPGMTGQVKEDIITRFVELGVAVENGQIVFNPQILKKQEFLTTSEVFTYFDNNKQKQTIELQQNTLAFTYCQVPVIYHLSDKNKVQITDNKDNLSTIEGLSLNPQISAGIFRRSGETKKVEVFITI